MTDKKRWIKDADKAAAMAAPPATEPAKPVQPSQRTMIGKLYGKTDKKD